MPLPAAQPRTHAHTRSITYRGYRREDGLWDLEAELTDAKTYALDHSDRGHMPPGTPVHQMLIRLTIDDRMVVREIASSMDATPFAECQQGNDPMQRIVGASMSSGWRQAIDEALGGTRGCTHLRELLFGMATAAFQTLPSYRGHLRREAGLPEPVATVPPPHVDKCIGWALDGAVVARRLPQFVGWQPKQKRS